MASGKNHPGAIHGIKNMNMIWFQTFVVSFMRGTRLLVHDCQLGDSTALAGVACHLRHAHGSFLAGPLDHDEQLLVVLNQPRDGTISAVASNTCQGGVTGFDLKQATVDHMVFVSHCTLQHKAPRTLVNMVPKKVVNHGQLSLKQLSSHRKHLASISVKLPGPKPKSSPLVM